MDLSQPQVLRPFLQKHGIDPRKGLGQHFLCSSSVVRKIGDELVGIESALEIGPGPGVLTSMLCERIAHVCAIEVDPRMIDALAESSPCARVRQLNALDADLETILSQLPSPRAIVSNLPYYITGPLITKIAEAREAFDVAVLMMQKEVGARVLANPGTPARGSLSAYLQLQFEIRKVGDAPAGAFLPAPKVDSVVLAFRPKEPGYPRDREAAVFDLIRKGFRQPRKTLLNNLVFGFEIDRQGAEIWIQAAQLATKVRPQQLSNAEWVRLDGVRA